MTTLLPEIKHIYRGHLDSTRWERFIPREDDIIIATSFKSGTTWMQMIVLQLIFQGQDSPPLFSVSPWLDSAVHPLQDELDLLEAQKHRRFIKTHLPLDALPYYPQVKYVVVARDARDVFMSLWNHYSHFTPQWIERLNRITGRDRPFPPCPDDIRIFWREWITRGWFDWESEGYPFWSNLHHTQTWWDFRHLPNIIFTHYSDLLKNLEGEIRRVAAYLAIDVPQERWPAIVEAATFRSMKKNAEQIAPISETIVEGGAQTFIHKGTNGRWRDVLTADDLKLYESAMSRVLTADCADWLENGTGSV